jgi:hypothetical protein
LRFSLFIASFIKRCKAQFGPRIKGLEAKQRKQHFLTSEGEKKPYCLSVLSKKKSIQMKTIISHNLLSHQS